MVLGKQLGLACHKWFQQWALELDDLVMVIDQALNLEPVLTQMFPISYYNNKKFSYLLLQTMIAYC